MIQLIDWSTSTQQFGILNLNIEWIGRQPRRIMMLAAAASRTQGCGDIKQYERHPLQVCHLHQGICTSWWNEYLHGIGGRKPAKHFLSAIGVGWSIRTECSQQRLASYCGIGLHCGHSSEVAIDHIYLN
jgi:hypothetical protein